MARQYEIDDAQGEKIKPYLGQYTEENRETASG